METTVVNQNNAQKGLIYYGDANSSIGIGVVGNEVEFWKVKDDKRTVISSAGITAGSPITLKLIVQEDLTCKVFYKVGNSTYVELAGAEAPKVDFLTQWDRSPRIGLNFKGKTDQNAVFSSFTLSYK